MVRDGRGKAGEGREGKAREGRKGKVRKGWVDRKGAHPRIEMLSRSLCVAGHPACF